MTRHLLKLIWNRKKSNVLLILEVFGSFLALFFISLMSLHYTDNFRQPLGYEYRNVISVDMNYARSLDPADGERNMLQARELLRAVDQFPEVETAAATFFPPFTSSGWWDDDTDRQIQWQMVPATLDLDKVLDLHVAEGRWFEQADEALDWRPVVINRELAEAYFGDESPLGKYIHGHTDYRVVGVVPSFRKKGDLSAAENIMLMFSPMRDVENDIVPQTLLLRVRPGTSAVFEEKLLARLKQLAPDWSFAAEFLAAIRERALRDTLMPVTIGAIIVGFLIVMVAFGLTGVMWQNVTQRTMEIGLRRAQGASVRSIFRQILTELLVICSFGLLLGVIVIIQFPLLDQLGEFSLRVYSLSIILSVLVILGFAVLSGLYPGWLATRIQPAEALHHE